LYTSEAYQSRNIFDAGDGFRKGSTHPANFNLIRTKRDRHHGARSRQLLRCRPEQTRSVERMTSRRSKMYTMIFSLAAALIACVGMMFYGTSAPMAGGFVIAAMSVGMAADLMRAKRRAAAK
jgi:hypothetical protein